MTEKKMPNLKIQINNSEEQLMEEKNPDLDIKITEQNKKERKIGNTLNLSLIPSHNIILI